MNKDKVGFYCWAGPSMIRMTNLKFFKPKIDFKSLMSSYDYDYLAKAKEKFNITDFWAMYSWGFSNSTEQEDYKFLTDRIKNFEKLNLNLHAYIQGPNVVYKEFPDADWYCVDEKNRPITYYRGRRVVCINNPEFIKYKVEQVRNMLNWGFSGIYMDNIQMGQMPVPTYNNELPYTFAGCNCKFCRDKFKTKYSQDIPVDMEKDRDITNTYLKFRVECVAEFLETIANEVHKGNLVFGSNSFDPKFNMEYTFGTNLKELDRIQDYILFENLSLPDNKKNNWYIEEICKNLKKPVFVVSYKKGIGKDSDFTQEDINNIYTEDLKFKFFECIKGSEYITENVWHNLYLEDYQTPSINNDLRLIHLNTRSSLRNPILDSRITKKMVKKYYNPFYTNFMEKRIWRSTLSKFYSVIV